MYVHESISAKEVRRSAQLVFYQKIPTRYNTPPPPPPPQLEKALGFIILTENGRTCFTLHRGIDRAARVPSYFRVLWVLQ